MQSKDHAPDKCQIVLTIPSRGRSKYLPALLDKLAATKSEISTIVVVSNGPLVFSHPASPSIHIVHIGDIPTVAVSVNFGWYALRTPRSILARMDNDIDPPANWEQEILDHYRSIDLGAFLALNETDQTDVIEVRGRRARRPHQSDSWNIPFLWSGFLWLSPAVALKLQYLDERFVRSTDGEIAERAIRIPNTTLAYCHNSGIIHRAPQFQQSTEPHSLVKAMYEATDLLIRKLPLREVAQDTLWSQCISKADAENIVRYNGRLPNQIVEKARLLLREKLESTYSLVERRELVDRIFTEIY